MSHTESEVERALRVKCEELDTAKDGTIGVAELRKAMAAIDGEELGASEVDEMVSEAGAQAGEGRVDYKKFIAAMYADE